MLWNNKKSLNLDNIEGLIELSDTQAESILGGFSVICYDENDNEVGADASTTDTITFNANSTVASVEFSTDNPGNSVFVEFEANGNLIETQTFVPQAGALYNVPAAVRAAGSFSVTVTQVSNQRLGIQPRNLPGELPPGLQ